MPLCLQDISGAGSPIAVQLNWTWSVFWSEIMASVGGVLIMGGSIGGYNKII